MISWSPGEWNSLWWCWRVSGGGRNSWSPLHGARDLCQHSWRIHVRVRGRVQTRLHQHHVSASGHVSRGQRHVWWWCHVYQHWSRSIYVSVSRKILWRWVQLSTWAKNISLINITHHLAAVCEPQCDNGGQCSAPDTCTCPPGYSGSHCQNDVDECALGAEVHKCVGDSVCVNRVGECWPITDQYYLITNQSQPSTYFHTLPMTNHN